MYISSPSLRFEVLSSAFFNANHEIKKRLNKTSGNGIFKWWGERAGPKVAIPIG
jgi:hypothetical protein